MKRRKITPDRRKRLYHTIAPGRSRILRAETVPTANVKGVTLAARQNGKFAVRWDLYCTPVDRMWLDRGWLETEEAFHAALRERFGPPKEVEFWEGYGIVDNLPDLATARWIFDWLTGEWVMPARALHKAGVRHWPVGLSLAPLNGLTVRQRADYFLTHVLGGDGRA
ncbi:MAG TPA: hypothetical protein VNQ78_09825 [Paracoccus sp. (in: a-proteobacteria)]|uniref:hypothetical protein n=1 Tax=Paracoccus sp. TaxID=267 RepID=UPI002C03FE61|nr:hypothetical protein [Paracoccus sp. (in: a-proteobacteria)]HWL56956.1 hypothetical protein [Paracoccus sp. (in: a-proteobacteria)]